MGIDWEEILGTNSHLQEAYDDMVMEAYLDTMEQAPGEDEISHVPPKNIAAPSTDIGCEKPVFSEAHEFLTHEDRDDDGHNDLPF